MNSLPKIKKLVPYLILTAIVFLLYANTFQNYWQENFGRGRFDYIKGQSGVQAYVTKYITKSKADYDLFTKKPLYGKI